jgi:hypothetical protein
MKANIMPHGWMKQKTQGRPRARLCFSLAVVWAAVAVTAAPLPWPGLGGGDEPAWHLLWLIGLPEAVFVGLAVFFRLTEVPREVPAVSGEWHGPIIH